MKIKVNEEIKALEHFEEITLRVSGEEMKKSEGYNLEYVLKTLKLTDNIIKKSYLHSQGKDRFTQQDKELFSVRLKDIEEGSLITQLQIVYSDMIIPMIPIVVENRELIWKSVKASYEFLKAKVGAAKEGKEFKVNQVTDSGGSNFSLSHINDSTINVNVFPGIENLAQKIAPDIIDMAKIVDGSNIDSVEVTDQQAGVLSITPVERELFKTQTYTQDGLFNVKGKIIDSNFMNLSGRIEITQENDEEFLCGDVYPFKVSSNLHSEESWKEMFLEEKEYFCKKRIEINPAKEPMTKIIELIIVDLNLSNQ